MQLKLSAIFMTLQRNIIIQFLTVKHKKVFKEKKKRKKENN